MHAYIHTYIHSFINSFIHTHTRIHVQIYTYTRTHGFTTRFPDRASYAQNSTSQIQNAHRNLRIEAYYDAYDSSDQILGI